MTNVDRADECGSRQTPRWGPKRILVLGCPGSGKTTVGLALAQDLGLPLHHLDDEFWGPGWTRLAQNRWHDRQHTLTAEPAWIIDGNHLSTVALRAARADLIVVVDGPTILCLARVVARAWRIRRGQTDLLPARIRAEAEAGGTVRATRDLGRLLRQILGFRWRELWLTIDESQSAGARPLVVVAVPGLVRARRAGIARRLRRRGITATVVRPSGLGAVIVSMSHRGSKSGSTLPEVKAS